MLSFFPESARTNPMTSILLNLSFKNIIPKMVTKIGVILARNETMAGFSTVFMAMKKKVVPVNSRSPITIKKEKSLGFNLLRLEYFFIDYCYFCPIEAPCSN